MSETVKQYIIDAKALHPERSAKSIYHELIARGIIASGDVSLSTVAQPFSPQSKGKIERWFQTLQNQWLNLLDWSSILNALFEVPFKYIGEQIKLRYDPTQLDKAYIFDDNGKCVETVYPVSKIDNSKVIRAKHKNPVDFSPFNV